MVSLEKLFEVVLKIRKYPKNIVNVRHFEGDISISVAIKFGRKERRKKVELEIALISWAPFFFIYVLDEIVAIAELFPLLFALNVQKVVWVLVKILFIVPCIRIETVVVSFFGKAHTLVL